MIELLRNRNPVFYLIAALYCIGVFLPLFFRDSLVVSHENSFVFAIMPREVFPESNTFWIVFGIILTYINSLYVNKIVVKFKILEQSGFLPSFVFITLTALYPELILSPASLVSVLILTWSIDRLFSIFDMELATQKLFFVGLAMGINTLFFSPSVLFFFVVIIALPVLKRPTWWEMTIIPFGFFVVIYLTVFTFYMQNKLNNFQQIIISTFPEAVLNFPGSFNKDLYALVFILFLLLFGFIKYYAGGTLRMVRQIRYNRVLNFYLLFSFIIIFLTGTLTFQSAILIILPFSIFISILFTENKGRLYNVLFYLMLLNMVANEVLRF